ncbi:PrpR N-terminal domain-containing protein, partial [Desulfosporosinus sp. BICA1-9]|uniref:PrpR N-terminal domain-containing protein n=1 Tax=Desulfosporosinus sp. BICA1-9 TaxID=1531958 RepID=UPI00054B2F55
MPEIKPTIAVISYRELTSLIQQIQYKPPEPVRILIIDALLEEALSKAKKMEENGEADVFLSAGGNAKLLSQNLTSSFVEIKVTGFDILSALKKA